MVTVYLALEIVYTNKLLIMNVDWEHAVLFCKYFYHNMALQKGCIILVTFLKDKVYLFGKIYWRQGNLFHKFMFWKTGKFQKKICVMIFFDFNISQINSLLLF